MWTRQHKKRNLGVLIVPAVAAVFLSYFSFHAWHGEYGLYAKNALETRAGELQSRLDAMRAERVELEQRVQLLQDGTLEKDMLDEQIRSALNYAHTDEIVILRPASR